jgi:hypothetical protein
LGLCREAVEFIGEEIRHSRVGRGEKNLSPPDQHEVAQYVEEGEEIQVVHVHDGIIEDQSRRLLAHAGVQVEKNGQGEGRALSGADFRDARRQMRETPQQKNRVPSEPFGTPTENESVRKLRRSSRDVRRTLAG